MHCICVWDEIFVKIYVESWQFGAENVFLDLINLIVGNGEEDVT